MVDSGCGYKHYLPNWKVMFNFLLIFTILRKLLEMPVVSLEACSACTQGDMGLNPGGAGFFRFVLKNWMSGLTQA